jgi:hypothetical protein
MRSGWGVDEAGEGGEGGRDRKFVGFEDKISETGDMTARRERKGRKLRI